MNGAIPAIAAAAIIGLALALTRDPDRERGLNQPPFERIERPPVTPRPPAKAALAVRVILEDGRGR